MSKYTTVAILVISWIQQFVDLIKHINLDIIKMRCTKEKIGAERSFAPRAIMSRSKTVTHWFKKQLSHLSLRTLHVKHYKWKLRPIGLAGASFYNLTWVSQLLAHGCKVQGSLSILCLLVFVR